MFGLWIHLKCSGLSKKQFMQLGNDSSQWSCKQCANEAYPFHSLDNQRFRNFICESQDRFKEPPMDFVKQLPFKTTCSVCSRRVINSSKSLPCHHCQSFIHKKCSRLPNWQFHGTSAILKNWYCSFCCEKYSHLTR